MDLKTRILTWLLAATRRVRAINPKDTYGQAGGDLRAAMKDLGEVGVKWHLPTTGNTDVQAVRRKLAAMEREGLLARFAPDGRLTHVKLTSAGEAAARGAEK